MIVHILTETGESTNERSIVEVSTNKEYLREKMKKLFESSKKFWGDTPTNNYEEVHIECYNDYAEAYCIDADYLRTGMSWCIEDWEVTE